MIQDRRVAALRLLCGAFLVLLAATPPRDAAAQDKVAVPHNLVLVQLVRSTMIALNHANFTGNYTVLRDLGAPSFRDANSSARLAAIFSNIRGKKLELRPLLVVNPVFTPPPGFDKNGLLRLRGYFPTRPERVNFNLSYQVLANRWRLFGISVGTTPTGTTPATEPKALIDLEDTPGRRTTPQPPGPKPRRRP